MKKIISFALAFVMTFGICSVASAQDENFIKKTNTKETVPEGFVGIYTVEDLIEIRNNLSGKYILMNDIDLSAYENWEPIGDRNEAFCGIFSGNGYSVQNLKIDNTGNTEIISGLFGYTKNAIIFNLSIFNAVINIDGTESVCAGTIVGLCSGGTIANCISSGSITVSVSKKGNVGGIAGYSKTDIINCFSDVSFKVDCGTRLTYVGGITGVTHNIISQSSNKKSLSISSESDAMVVAGGIAGGSFNEIINCFNIGNVNAFSSSYVTAGGIAGESCSILNSYNAGEVSAETRKEGAHNVSVGGISGYTNFKMSIIDQSEKEEYDSKLINCYYLDIISQATSNPEKQAMSNVVALSIDELKNKNSFVGFDFERVWNISSGNTPSIVSDVVEVYKILEIKVQDLQQISKDSVSIIWSDSADKDIAVMDKMGNVEGVSEGTTEITFITCDGQLETCEISVIKMTFIQIITDFFEQIFICLFGWIFN